MIFFVISCFSFILLSKSFSFKGFMVPSSRLLAWFWIEISHFIMVVFGKSVVSVASLEVSKEAACGKAENATGEEGTCLLDLPELPMDCILERLPPASLCSMAGVCTSLRERCSSDHLWERHMKQKWGRLISDVACREWEWQIASSNRSTLSNRTNRKAILGYFSSLWLHLHPKLANGSRTRSFLQKDSVMACYLALETGKFWFPAQVYNRENGHVGFMLSCYDAELSYDFSTDTFKARFSPYGRRTIEENIEWHRVRAPAVDTPAHVLHASDCLDDLRPGDHIEIQWRRNKEFPYGWWYGVVGHLESCSRDIIHCKCHSSDTIILEFKQYTPGSRWRRTAINRKNHREFGNGADGFYGGIRKLYNDKEISVWKRLWPNQFLE